MRWSMNRLIQWQQASGQWEDEQGKTRTERILWINDCASHVVVIDVDHKNVRAKPICKPCTDIEQALEAGVARWLDKDPYQHLYQEDTAFKKKYIECRELAWQRIEDIVAAPPEKLFDPLELARLIREAEKKAGLQIKKNIYIYLRYYWQGGQTKNALLPRYEFCSRWGKDDSAPKEGSTQPAKKNAPDDDTPSRFVVTEEVKGQFLWGTREYYEGKLHLSLTDTFFEIKKQFYTRPDWNEEAGKTKTELVPPGEQPTFRQYRYWFYQYRDRNKERSLIARAGLRTYQQQMRPVLGSARTNILGPGSMYYYDATIPDVYLVSRLNRAHIIGRPVVHVLIDLFSGLIVGVAVVLEGPSWVGAMLALENMCRNKVDYCAEYGIPIPEAYWPSHHVPEGITGDRGELFYKDINTFAKLFHVLISNTPPYRPDWKGLIERFFRILEDTLISWMPGHIPQVPRRGGPDYRLDAVLTVDDFRKVLIAEIIRYNRSHAITTEHWDAEMISADLAPYPCELWKWGEQYRNGSLDTRPLTAIQRSLLRRDKASVQEDGIHFDGARYSCDRAIQNHWFVREPDRQNRDLAAQQENSELSEADRGKYLPIRYDPRTRDVIYLVLDGGKTFEKCELIDPDRTRFGESDWYDIDDYLARERQAKREREPAEEQVRLETEEYQQEVFATAERLTQEALSGVTKTERLTDIRGHRQADNAYDRQQHAWHTPPPPVAALTIPSSPDEAIARRLALLDEDE